MNRIRFLTINVSRELSGGVRQQRGEKLSLVSLSNETIVVWNGFPPLEGSIFTDIRYRRCD